MKMEVIKNARSERKKITQTTTKNIHKYNQNRSSVGTMGSPPFISSLPSRNVETLGLRSDKDVTKNRNYITAIADVHEGSYCSPCRSSSKVVNTFSPFTESQNTPENESNVSTVLLPQNEDHALSHVTDDIANDRGYSPMLHSTSIEDEH